MPYFTLSSDYYHSQSKVIILDFSMRNPVFRQMMASGSQVCLRFPSKSKAYGLTDAPQYAHMSQLMNHES